MKKPVIMTAREACGHIRDGAVIVNTGMLLAANAEAVLTAMEESFLQTSKRADADAFVVTERPGRRH